MSDSLENARNDQTRSCRVIDRDARSFRVPVAQRRARPPNPELFPPPGDGRGILVRREVATIGLLQGGTSLCKLPFIVLDDLANRFWGQK
ncbi:MAG TPA: hypothetical protein PLR35_04210, partial [Burkholderiaceae bacterium]|nr:hypothetical protein [Burkholderiaceae bacterium]